MRTYNIKEQIKTYFLINPTARLRVRQIERKLGLPLPSVIRYTRELTEEGILRKLESAGISLYTTDRGSHPYLLEKRLFNLRSLHDSGLVTYLIYVLHNPVIIVFGSYARGEDIEQSDIDLYLESPAKKKPDISKYESALHRPIHLLVHQSIREIKNKELANNILNGTIIHGHIEVFR